MHGKVLITILLLLFVGVSLLYVIARETDTPDTAEVDQIADAAVEETSENAVIAYYFHYTRRCATCNKIEELSNRVVTERFADELKDGRLIWKSLNVEDSGYEHFEKDYGLISQSLVLVDAREGRKMKWKNLDKIWELVSQEDKFLDYVHSEIKAFLESS